MTGGTRNCFLSGLPLPQAHQHHHQVSMEAWRTNTTIREACCTNANTTTNINFLCGRRTNTTTREAWKYGAPMSPPTPGRHGSMAHYHQHHHEGSMEYHQRSMVHYHHTRHVLGVQGMNAMQMPRKCLNKNVCKNQLGCGWGGGGSS